jgi:hypothetical protein
MQAEGSAQLDAFNIDAAVAGNLVEEGRKVFGGQNYCYLRNGGKRVELTALPRPLRRK